METTARIPVRHLLSAVAIAAVAMLIFARRASAQSEVTVGPFVTVVPSDYESHAPTLTGLAIAGYGGALGARVSGAMAIDATPRSPTSARVSAISSWIADGDVLLRVGGRERYQGLLPDVAIFGFLGLGATAWRDAVDSMRIAQSWSQGGGIAVGLGQSVELSGEARYRRPLVFQTDTRAPFAPRMEYRAGISLRFGSGGGSRRRSSSIPGRSSQPAPLPAPRAPTESRIPVSWPTSGVGAARVIPTAEQYLGTPYRYGGVSPATGFDCSGFVRYVYAKHGVSLPRTSREMASSGTRLKPDFGALRAGDLVMFAEQGAAISHVAVYAGGNRIIHASSSAGKVRYDDLDSDRGQWFKRRIVAARRVTVDGRGIVADLTAALLEDRTPSLTFEIGDRAPRP
jgi:cell wall-associated NlpC family hydrolase